ncbi:MAG TPA: phosphoserine transaminase [Aestuariivirgaceae bacterium]|nr:phosphoserine transaminase [Aestuariivirgaceae bacterium]
MTLPERPERRPGRPHFSSGPCAKFPGWSPQALTAALTGRSHRSREGKARLKLAIDLTRTVLEIPASHRIGIVPASDTGAMELAMWSMLGARGVDMLAFESFGLGWVNDVETQLKPTGVRVLAAPYGELPDLAATDPDRDIVFTWNGTTSGVRVPDAEWIAADRKGLTLCDATSGIFAQRLDYGRLDVVTFSWQKALGGEAAHGMIVLSPRAVERLTTHTPPWPMPKIFRLASKGELNEAVFAGETINTPSMLCVEDWIAALNWALGIGGLDGLTARSDANAAVLDAWIGRTEWARHLARVPNTRSNTSVCITIDGTPDVPKRMAELLAEEGVALDIAAHRDSPPGLRIWCGATVETEDVVRLVPWLDWAHAASTRGA